MKQIVAWLTGLFTVSFVASPAFTAPFTGYTADQLPIPVLQPPVQPAGYAFAIWGLIYTWLLVSAGYGIWKRSEDDDWHRTRLRLMASLALGTPWLWVANNAAAMSTVLIFAMLVTALMALLRSPAKDRWWLRTPVAIYTGWLSAAAFVSLGAVAPGYGILMDAEGWAYVCIAVALLLAAVVQRRMIDTPAYGLTIVWALAGIIVANLGANLGVAVLAAVGITLMVLVILFRPAERLT